MEIINQFKKTLLENGGSASKVTVKNYTADVRKFALWYEKTYQRPFPPSVIPNEIVEAYLSPLSEVSPRSAKRYRSSLNKLLSFLLAHNKIPYNPLSVKAESSKPEGLWHLKSFNNFLYVSNSSPITIKNYINDVSQFFKWAQVAVQSGNSISTQDDVFAKIDSFLIEEYKNRLLNEAGFSPLSVNRKLSSLRKYLSWAQSKGIIKNKIEVAPSVSGGYPGSHEDAIQAAEVSLEALTALNMAEEVAGEADFQELPLEQAYSRFAPLRLLQKTKKGTGFIFDTLVILSILKTIEYAKYNLWKKAGKEVFAPLPTIIKSLNQIEEAVTDQVTKQPISVVDRFVRMGNKASIGRIRGIPKAVFAPHKISTQALPYWEKLRFNLQHKRPTWYKRYHSYSFVHYVHAGIIVIFAAFLGFRIYQTFNGAGNHLTALASTRIAPNRQIAFKGRLNDASGTPITKESIIKFAIYKNQAGGALLWQEKQTVNPDSQGNFSVSLGKANPISQDLFSTYPDLYLGISIGQDPELEPRHQLANVGLTKNAQELQGLKPITANNSITANVILALDSSGNLTIGGSSAPIFQATGGEFTLTGQQLTLATNPGSNTNIVLNPDGKGIIDVLKPLQNTSENNNLLTALGAVEVDDNFAILASSSAQSALIINQNGTGDLISAATGDTARFTLTNNGSGTFAGDLKILGNNLSTATGTFNIANQNTQNLNIGGAATLISIGAPTGTTTVNNGLRVSGLITAYGGINLPTGKSFTLSEFISGSIPFINSANQLSQDNLSFFWDQTNKRLGVGTSTPSKTVDVQGEIQVNLAGTQTSTALCGSHANATGATVSDVTIVDCIGTPAADYMEMYSVEEGLELGDIVVPASSYIMTNNNDRLTRLKKSNAAYQSSVIGIISDKSKAGDFNSIGHNIKAEDNPQPIALTGRVPVKISQGSPAIQPGDYLTSSNEPGRAMKSERAGVIIGKALEAWDPSSGKDKILIFANLSWHDPKAVLMDNGSLATAYETPAGAEDTNTANETNEFINTIKTGLLEAQKISTNSLSIATEDIMIGTQTLRDYITSIVEEILERREAEKDTKTIVVLSPLAEISPTVTPSPQPDQAPSPMVSPTAAPTTNPSASQSPSVTNITNIYNNASENQNSSSSSANVASPSASPAPTPTADPATAPTTSPTPLPENNPSPPLTPPVTPDNQASASSTPGKTDYELIQMATKQSADTKSAQIASFSAELSYIPNLKADFGKFELGLIALGPVSLAETSISGQLSVGSNLQINENSINTFGGDLNLQPLRQGNLAIMGGLVAIDTQGNLTVEGNATFAKDVTVRGTLAAGIISPLDGSDLVVRLRGKTQNGRQNNADQRSSAFTISNEEGSAMFSVNDIGDVISSGSAKFANLKIIRGAQADTSFTETVASGSAGTAVITANETERTIVSPFVFEDSLIYITPVSATNGLTPYIARQTVASPATGVRASFTIQIPQSVPQNIKLNWWIIN